jgi:hypothetical protein
MFYIAITQDVVGFGKMRVLWRRENERTTTPITSVVNDCFYGNTPPILHSTEVQYRTAEKG